MLMEETQEILRSSPSSTVETRTEVDRMVSRRSTHSVTQRSTRQSELHRRPRRLVAPKVVDDAVGLSRTEERDLKKALYASLQETRRNRTPVPEEESTSSRDSPSKARIFTRLSSPSSSRASSSHASLSRATLSRASLSRGSVSRASLSRASLSRASLSRASLSRASLEVKKRSRRHPAVAALDESSQDSVRSSVSSLRESKKKVHHAQRKFAQGSSGPSTPSTSANKKAANAHHNVLDRVPKTEDFLTFLCLRGSHLLPANLDFFHFARDESSLEESGSGQRTPIAGEGKNVQTRESTPESSSSSGSNMNEELRNITTPVTTPLRLLQASRKAARASAGTPETARGIVSLRQGLTRKVVHPGTTPSSQRSRKYLFSPHAPRLSYGDYMPAKKSASVKCLSASFLRSTPAGRLALERNGNLSAASPPPLTPQKWSSSGSPRSKDGSQGQGHRQQRKNVKIEARRQARSIVKEVLNAVQLGDEDTHFQGSEITLASKEVFQANRCLSVEEGQKCQTGSPTISSLSSEVEVDTEPESERKVCAKTTDILDSTCAQSAFVEIYTDTSNEGHAESEIDSREYPEKTDMLDSLCMESTFVEIYTDTDSERNDESEVDIRDCLKKTDLDSAYAKNTYVEIYTDTDSERYDESEADIRDCLNKTDLNSPYAKNTYVEICTDTDSERNNESETDSRNCLKKTDLDSAYAKNTYVEIYTDTDSERNDESEADIRDCLKKTDLNSPYTKNTYVEICTDSERNDESETDSRDCMKKTDLDSLCAKNTYVEIYTDTDSERNNDSETDIRDCLKKTDLNSPYANNTYVEICTDTDSERNDESETSDSIECLKKRGLDSLYAKNTFVEICTDTDSERNDDRRNLSSAPFRTGTFLQGSGSSSIEITTESDSDHASFRTYAPRGAKSPDHITSDSDHTYSSYFPRTHKAQCQTVRGTEFSKDPTHSFYRHRNNIGKQDFFVETRSEIAHSDEFNNCSTSNSSSVFYIDEEVSTCSNRAPVLQLSPLVSLCDMERAFCNSVLTKGTSVSSRTAIARAGCQMSQHYGYSQGGQYSEEHAVAEREVLDKTWVKTAFKRQGSCTYSTDKVLGDRQQDDRTDNKFQRQFLSFLSSRSPSSAESDEPKSLNDSDVPRSLDDSDIPLLFSDSDDPTYLPSRGSASSEVSARKLSSSGTLNGKKSAKAAASHRKSVKNGYPFKHLNVYGPAEEWPEDVPVGSCVYKNEKDRIFYRANRPQSTSAPVLKGKFVRQCSPPWNSNNWLTIARENKTTNGDTQSLYQQKQQKLWCPNQGNFPCGTGPSSHYVYSAVASSRYVGYQPIAMACICGHCRLGPTESNSYSYERNKESDMGRTITTENHGSDLVDNDGGLVAETTLSSSAKRFAENVAPCLYPLPPTLSSVSSSITFLHQRLQPGAFKPVDTVATRSRKDARANSLSPVRKILEGASRKLQKSHNDGATPTSPHKPRDRSREDRAKNRERMQAKQAHREKLKERMKKTKKRLAPRKPQQTPVKVPVRPKRRSSLRLKTLAKILGRRRPNYSLVVSGYADMEEYEEEQKKKAAKTALAKAKAEARAKASARTEGARGGHAARRPKRARGQPEKRRTRSSSTVSSDDKKTADQDRVSARDRTDKAQDRDRSDERGERLMKRSLSSSSPGRRDPTATPPAVEPKRPRREGGMGMDRRSSTTSSTGRTSSKESRDTSRRSSFGTLPVLQRKRVTPRRSAEKASTSTSSPTDSGLSDLDTVPTFYPTDEEFTDPITYIASIREEAEPHGMCCIIPPASWKMESKVNDEIRFTTQVQHLHRLFNRWGPSVEQTRAITHHLSDDLDYASTPQIGGVEVDLPQLYRMIRDLGGLQNIVDKKQWVKVADAMKIPKTAHDRVTRLYDVYCKFVLPYAMLSETEREQAQKDVHGQWESSSAEEDAVFKGKSMTLGTFSRVARNVQSMWFREDPSTEMVETTYWRLVEKGKTHVSVQCAHVNTRAQSTAFPTRRESPYFKHPWNLNNLPENKQCILKCLGPVSGTTIPTLHVGMLFSTCCWSTDLHRLPYVHYLHSGANTIWYCIAKNSVGQFHDAMKELSPSLIHDDPLWLKEDTTMVKPDSLKAKGVSVARCVQQPRQFVVVFPDVYTATVSCGYSVSESVHYATSEWLSVSTQAAEALCNSGEKELFSVDTLVCGLCQDSTDVDTLMTALPLLQDIVARELDERHQLSAAGLKCERRLAVEDSPGTSASVARKRSHDLAEDSACEVCFKICYLSMVLNEHDEQILCLEHGLKYVQRKRHVKAAKLFYRYTEEELTELVQSTKDRLTALQAAKANNGPAPAAKKKVLKRQDSKS